MIDNDPLSLDDLWRTVRPHITAQRKEREAAALRKTAEPSSDMAVLYANPDNWTRTRGIALIHAETQTLLGNFDEFIHNSVPNCRKLLRSERPCVVSSTEQVSGNWWLGVERRPEPKQVWHERRPAILHLHLDRLKVHSPACEVIACLSYGGLARVELAADTQFAQEDGKQEQLLFLPAGTNVLGEMSLDSKINLHAELGR